MYKFGYWGVIVIVLVLISCNTKQRISSSESDERKAEFELEFLQHKRWMHDCLKKYIEYSSFTDATNRVSIERIEEFKNLFLENAKVWNDYLWEPRFEYANIYADKVYFLHRIKGLKVSYEDEVLNQFYTLKYEDLDPRVDRSEPTNIKYKYTLNLKKRVYYILNKEQKVIYYDEPVEFDLDFIFYISSEEKKAVILDILPKKN